MSPTSHEIELKLEAPAHALARLTQSSLLRSAANGSSKTSTLVSVYFDTDGLKLRKKGLSLRVRRVGGRHVQTVKQEGGEGGPFFTRKEWEHEIGGAQPDLTVLRETELEPLLNRKLRRDLKPLFETRVRRSVFPIRDGGSEIELAIDKGVVEAGPQSLPLCEVELQLKRGEPSELFELAHKIAKRVPARLAVKSKAERGYELIGSEEPKAVRAAPIALTPTSSRHEAFQSIVRECLRQLTANEPAMRAGDPEGLHQMRVGLRRLRVAISLFADILRDPQTEEIVAKLKWISGELGPARELDIFIDSVAMPAMHEQRNQSGLVALFKDLKRSREDAFCHACAAIESGRFHGLVVDVVGWIEAGDWTRSTDDVIRTLRKQPIAGFAEDEMRRCWAQVLKRGRKLAQLGRKRRHKLRIQAKKLRYASEFFAGAFPCKKATKRRKTFVARLEKLQDALGDLNDIAVHEVLTERIVDEQNVSGKPRGDSARMAFAAGRLAGREEARAASVVKGAVYAHSTFAKTKPFWRQR